MDEQQLVRPTDYVTRSIARVSVSEEGYSRVYFPEYLTEFNECVKPLLYKWSKPYWVLIEKDQPLEDRQAELVAVLLANGFCVKAPRLVIEMVANKNYKRANRHVIDLKEELVFVCWPPDEDFSIEVKSIPSARKSGYGYTISLDQFESVYDFAEQHNFHITSKAMQALNDAESELNGATIIDVHMPDSKPKAQKRTVLEEQEFDIDSEFLDD